MNQVHAGSVSEVHVVGCRKFNKMSTSTNGDSPDVVSA
jgi:hypothetical protein